MDALEPYRVKGPDQNPKVLPYLEFNGKKNFDIELEVAIRIGSEETTITKSNFKYMYWNMCQQLAHHTVNGCNVEVGDLYASGTISGPQPGSFGSMLEITWNGKNPITLADGSKRQFIEDGDSVILRGFAQKNGVRIGFGECKGQILPAN
jgi:fumarylacetoacetase